MRDDPRTPEQIERDIAREREGLTDTLGTLQDRLSMEGIMHEVSDRLRDQGGEIGRNVSAAVRDNPMALALTGVGLAWMIFGGRNGHAGDHRYTTVSHGRHRHAYDDAWDERDPAGLPPYGAPGEVGYAGAGDPSWAEVQEAAAYGDGAEYHDGTGDGAFARAGSAGHDAAERSRERVRAARSRISEGTEHLSKEARERVIEARHRALDVRDRARSGARDASGRLRHGARSARDRAYDGARHAGDRASRAVSEGSEQAVDYFERHPLVVGALALAAGAALGGSAPSTRAENRAMGEYRGELFEEAERLLREESRKAKAVGGAAADEARDIAGEKREQVRSAANDAGDRARSAAGRARDEVEDAGRRIGEAAKSEARDQHLGKPNE